MSNSPQYSYNEIGKHTLQVIATADRFNAWIYDEFKTYLYGEILELGSGIGNISKFPIKDKFNLTLSDYDEEYYEFLKKTFSSVPNIKDILRVDLQDTSLKEKYTPLHEKFDTVFLMNVVEHLEDDMKTITNCSFFLKPGGTLIVLVPAYPFLYCRLDKNLGHYKRYTLQQAETLFVKNNFRVIKKKYVNLLGIVGWFLFGKIFKINLLKKNEISAFNFFVPLAKILDKIVFNKAGLSIIIAGKKL